MAVIDAGDPRNALAEGVHGFLSRDGMSPLDLLEAGRAEVRRYGGHIVPGLASSVQRQAGSLARSALEGESPEFTVTLADGRVARARRLLVTTGLVDELPDVAGLRERWGRDVVHCPYCHGWEIRDQPIGVLASGPRAVHQALLFRQWSAGITLFLHTTPAPSRDEAAQLAARGITVVPGVVASLEIGEDRLMAAVPGSVASGSLAAAAINADLIAEETAQAVAAAAG